MFNSIGFCEQLILHNYAALSNSILIQSKHHRHLIIHHIVASINLNFITSTYSIENQLNKTKMKILFLGRMKILKYQFFRIQNLITGRFTLY